MAGILEIRSTDGGRVNLLADKYGFHLDKWNPGRLQMKGGGIWHDSPIADGRSLVNYNWGNIVDTFTFKQSGPCQDDTIWYSQEFDRLLVAAAEYGKRKSNVAVYLVSRGSNETNTSYALIHGWKLPNDNNPYQDSFAGWISRSAQEKLVLVIEHGPWLDHVPGEGSDTAIGTLCPVNHAQEDNPSFEEWGAGVPTGWANIGTAVLTENTNQDYIVSGVTSVGMDNSNLADRGIYLSSVGFDPSPSGIYHFSVKVWVVSGTAVMTVGESFGTPSGIYDTTASTTKTGEWVTLEFFKQGIGSFGVFLYTPTSTGGAVYFDDFKCLTYHGNVDERDQRWQPAASNQDCHTVNNTTSIDLTASNLRVGWDNGATEEYNAGVVFNNVLIDQGATIREAYLQVHYGGVVGGPVAVDIWGEDADTAAAFTTTGDFNGRTKTTATVAWSITGATDEIEESPDITSIIQEIVNRPGWASGNDMGMFLFEDTGQPASNVYARIKSWDEGTYAPMTLFVVLEGQAVPVKFTIAPTTDHVYVANKQNRASLTHIYFDATGTWSNNQMDASFPWTVLGGSLNNAIYFGSEIGPFASTVFDTDVPYEDSGGNNNIIWEYWDTVAAGGSWVAIPDFVDWTDDERPGLPGATGTGPFSRSGIISFHFDPDMAGGDWGSANLFTIHGGSAPAIDAWWIRARIAGVVGVITPTSQQNRDVYTITWPYTEIQNGEVGGDIMALAKTVVNNLTDGATATSKLGAYKRLLIGSRRVARGDEFEAYLNFSDVQRPSFITDISLSGFWLASYIDYVNAPTGRCIEIVDNAPPESGSIDFTIARSHVEQFFGRFRFYLRLSENTAAQPIRFWIELTYGKDTFYYLETTSIHSLYDFAIMDFGEVTIPSSGFVAADTFDNLEIKVHIYFPDTVTSLRLYDLIMMPVDEVFIDVYQDPSYYEYIGAGTSAWQELVADSVNDPRRYLRTFLRSEEYLYRYRSYVHEGNGPFAIEPNERVRYWFMGWTEPGSGIANYSHPVGAETVEMNHVQRYTGRRGRR